MHSKGSHKVTKSGNPDNQDKHFLSMVFRRFLSKTGRPSSFFVGSALVTSCIGASAVFCTASSSSEQVHDRDVSDVPRLLYLSAPPRYIPSCADTCLDGRLIPLFDDEAVSRTIFGHISAEYDALGQIEVGEVDVTVQPHVFSQIGVVDKEGVRAMCKMILSENAFANGKLPIVFCDIGSGVGNVLLQVLAEIPQCSRVVGVEVIPSRHEHAVKAYEAAKTHFPKWFSSTLTETRTTKTTTTKTQILDSPRASSYEETTSESETSCYRVDKDAVFHLADLVGAAPLLKNDQVNVIFSHSWMFDDDLMAKFANVVANSGPQMKMVFTSRPFSSPDGIALLPAEWSCAGLTALSSDWNPESPFYVYVRS